MTVGGADRVKISVVVPCYQSLPFIEPCIGSLLAQTLDPELFEVVLVFNGEEDGASEVAQRLLSKSSLKHQSLHSEPGAGAARNHGVSHARGQWVTFVDVDDEISADYLSLLAASASSADVIPVAGLIDVDMDGEEHPSRIHRQLVTAPAQNGGAEIASALAIVVLKLLPTELMRDFPFDVELDSGEDVALFAWMAGKENLSFDTSPAKSGALYRRRVRPGSVGRQADSFDFLVRQRLDVIERLEEQYASAGHLASTLEMFISAQAKFISRYLEGRPEDQDGVVGAIRERNLVRFPWGVLNLASARVFICEAFAPDKQPAAALTAKRLYQSGDIWNVITMGHPGALRDGGLTNITQQAVSSVERLPLIDDDEPLGMAATLAAAWSRFHQVDQQLGGVTEITSWAAHPWPHMAAALARVRAGDRVRWDADLVDARSAALPAASGHPWPDVDLLGELGRALEEAGFRPPALAGPSEAWVEALTAVFARRVSFTTVHQLTLTCRGVADPDLRRLLWDKAVVAPPVSLPRSWYERISPLAERTPFVTHIAYFGEAGEGIGSVLSALASLEPAEASRLQLHLFSPDHDALGIALARHPYRPRVTVYTELPFVRYLHAITQFDAVIVTDIADPESNARLNVHLPWQWADCSSTDTPLWKVVETGSVLSRQEAAFTSNLRDVQSSREVLAKLSCGGQ